MKFLRPTLTILMTTIALTATAAHADPAAAEPTVGDQNIFVMGGPFSQDYFGDTLLFGDNVYEDNFFGGIGYQKFFYQHPRGLKLGVEAGVGLRVGERTSAELWAGGVVRADLQFGDITIAPALTAGLSAVTDTIGVESDRAEAIGKAVPVLFYLGPEISVSHADAPNLELLARVQHRSGGFGTIAPIDGSNAAVLGMRYNF